MSEELLTLQDAARALNLSRTALWELYDKGKVPGRQLDGRGCILFRKSELKRALLPKEKRNA